MPTIITASTPEQTLEFVVKLIRHEQEKFTTTAAHRSTPKSKHEYQAKAATCEHLAMIFENVIIESAPLEDAAND
jgi:hypothetical protein